MEITVLRGTDDGQAVPGHLVIAGPTETAFSCETLEPSHHALFPTIPSGRFLVCLIYSYRFQELTPHIVGVPGRTAIEIHPGNSPADTHGCLLVGKSFGIDWIIQSRETFLVLMDFLRNRDLQDSIYITYKDAN